MTKGQAIAAAEQARPAHRVPSEARVTDAELRYIELAGPDPEVPAPVRDVLAWLVRFEADARLVELAIDDQTAQVVRVERSR